jgi:hypothetical protein
VTVDGPIARHLTADHARLDALLRRATARPDAVDAASYADFRGGLLRHVAIEEKLLLPAAQRARGGAPLAIAARLRLDHGAIAALLVPTPKPAIVETLRTILEAHDAIEEGPDGLYATCDRLLAAEAESLVAGAPPRARARGIPPRRRRLGGRRETQRSFFPASAMPARSEAGSCSS